MDLKASYERDGYVVFPQLLKAKEVAAIELYVDRIYHQWKVKNTDDIFNYKLVNMHSLTLSNYIEGESRVAFFNAISTYSLVTQLSALFGSDIYFHNTQLFFNPTNPARLPYWHRDMQYSKLDESQQAAALSDMLSLHVRIPLEDEAGVAVIPGSHKRWDTLVEREVRFELNGHRNSDSLPNERLISLTRGDVMVFSSQMVHRGHYDANLTRKAFDLCVGTYHPLTAPFLDPRVLPNDQEMKQVNNPQWYELARKISA